MRSHTKFGPNRFSRFNVYWIQPDRQTDKQTSKVFIEIVLFLSFRQIFPGTLSRKKKLGLFLLDYMQGRLETVKKKINEVLRS